MSALKVPKLYLRGGKKIPQIALGVWEARPEETKQAVLSAFKFGYRHIDTAAIYQNEVQVGEAIKESGIPREELFITTKLWNKDQGYDSALKACDLSLKKLGLQYIDLYLIHSPVKETRLDSWKALEELKRNGKVKSIGVSNYGIHHLKELFDNSTILPDVNQIELSPFLARSDLCNFCTENNIVVEAYSPLTRGHKLNDERLVRLANKYGKTSAQILIRWGIQKGYVSLPKSTREKRIKENFDVFDWKIEENELIEMNSWDENYVCGWDPTVWD